MNVTVPLAKNILVPLGVTATASAIDAEIQKKKQDNHLNKFKQRN